MPVKLIEFVQRLILHIIAFVNLQLIKFLSVMKFGFYLSICFFRALSFSKILFVLRSENNFINLTKEKNFKLKNFTSVNYNFNLGFYKRIMEEILFVEDLNKSLIAGGCFTNYVHNNLSLDFPDVFKLFCEQKDIDIYIESTKFAKYKKKYNTRIFKNKKYYPLSFYSMKFIWKDIKINLIFAKNNMALIQKFDFDFIKIFYSYSKHSIYAFCTLFELFDNQIFNILNECHLEPSYLWFYEKKLLEKKIMYFNLKRKFLSNDFIRYDLCRYVKYAFKGFHEMDEEKKIKNIITYYESILTQFLK